MDLTPEQVEMIISGILQIIGAFSVTAAFVPKSAKPYISIIRKVINFGAFNIKNAKNKDD